MAAWAPQCSINLETAVSRGHRRADQCFRWPCHRGIDETRRWGSASTAPFASTAPQFARNV